MQGLSPAESVQRARRDFANLTLRNWKFWVPAQFVQFAFLAREPSGRLNLRLLAWKNRINAPWLQLCRP